MLDSHRPYGGVISWTGAVGKKGEITGRPK